MAVATILLALFTRFPCLIVPTAGTAFTMPHSEAACHRVARHTIPRRADRTRAQNCADISKPACGDIPWHPGSSRTVHVVTLGTRN